jgi:uncharacterized membrane protein YfhO
VARPARIDPLSVYVYSLRDARPRRELAPPADGAVAVSREAPGHIALVVDADRPGVVIVREAFAPGWSAEVSGSEAALLAAEEHHLAVRVPQGRSAVVLRYRPPGGRAGAVLTAASLLACAVMLSRRGPAGGVSGPRAG